MKLPGNELKVSLLKLANEIFQCGRIKEKETNPEIGSRYRL